VFRWRGLHRLWHELLGDDLAGASPIRHPSRRLTTAARRRRALIEARAERLRIQRADRELFRMSAEERRG
jgi:hypothetical protein